MRCLLRALAKVDPANEYLLFSPGSAPRISQIRNSPFAIRNLTKLWFEQISFPRACQREEVDVAHVPYFAPPLRPTSPTVVTIHDLIPLILPAYRGSLLVQLYTRLVSAAARRAEAIIADSECSKRDIVRLLGMPPERVHVIYLAGDERFRPVEDVTHLEAIRRKYSLPERYVLYLGGFDQRKNLATLLQAFAHLRKALGDKYQLAIAGELPAQDTPFFPHPRRLAWEVGLEKGVIFIGWVSEEDKPALYSAATLFVFPSLYEGFGLPVLEAMACGTPVIASNAASLTEVVGDGGLLVEPQDVDALAEAMIAVLTDSRLRASLRQRGLEQARRFSWERTARETLGVYREMMG